MGPKQYAFYPFIRDAVFFVKDSGVTIEDLITSPAFEQARSRGKRRVILALTSLTVDPSDIGERFDLAGDVEYLNEILSYAIGRVLVSIIDDQTLTRRYILAETKTMGRRLESRMPDYGEDEIIEDVSDQLEVKASPIYKEEYVDNRLNIEVYFKVFFGDYIRYSAGLKSKNWKLVNTEVKDGMVELPLGRLARLLENVLRDKLTQELPLPIPDWAIAPLEKDVKEIKIILGEWKAQNVRDNFGAVQSELFPPCMNHLLTMTLAGENLPHSGRFALTSFLSHIGMSNDEIMALFSQSPDFDTSKTKYQVDHITGETSSTKYTPPECATMKTYGICYSPDSRCRWVRHPLNYYLRRKGENKNQEKPQTKVENKLE